MVFCNAGTEQWHLMSCPGRYSSQPCGRHSHSAIVDGEFMWIFGGMTGLKEKNDLWKWNFITRQWTKVKTKGKGPAGLHGHSAIKSFGSMYIFGGERQGHLLHDLWSFNFATLTWRKITTEGIVPNPTSKHTSVANPFIEAESCSNGSEQYGAISRHSASLHHQVDCNHHGDIKEQEENEEETEVYRGGREEEENEEETEVYRGGREEEENEEETEVYRGGREEEENEEVYRGRKEESSPETPDFELDKLVLDAHANVVRRRMRPKSELVTFPSPDDTTDDLTYSEDMEWHNLKRHTVHESMSYYSLCFPSPQLSARLQAEGIRVPNPTTTDSPSIGTNGTSTFGTNGTSTFGTNGTSTFGTNGTSTFGTNGTSAFGTFGTSAFGNGHQVIACNNPILPPPPHPPSSMKTSLTSSGFSEGTVSSICDNDTAKRHRLSNSSSVSFNTDSLRSSTSAAHHQPSSILPSSSVLPSSSMSQVLPPPVPRFINRSRSFDRPILRNHHNHLRTIMPPGSHHNHLRTIMTPGSHHNHLRTIMTPGSVESKLWHPQINAIREVVVPTSPALTSKWSSYSPAKSCSGANARQWKLCMYVFGGREEGMSFIYKRPMSIWKLYI